MKNLSRAHVQSIYRPISVAFLVLVVVSMGGVAYTGWSSSTITITPLTTTVRATFPLTVGRASSDGSTVVGTVTTVPHSASVTVTPKGTGTPIAAHASGEVQLINTTAKVQPLSIGTRLRADNGVLVRTAARTDVPAGGRVTAKVVADPLGEEGNLAPGKFIIVALWPGLQDKIYAQSSQALTGGLAPAGASLSVNELTSASNQAEEKIRASFGGTPAGTLAVFEPADVVSEPPPEVASASYAVTVTVNVTTVTYDQKVFDGRQRLELQKSLADGQALVSVNQPTVRIQDRPTKDQVVLDVHAAGTAGLSPSIAAIQAAAFVGQTPDVIRANLIGTGNIKSVAVSLSPFWRTAAPNQANRITVKLNPAVPATGVK